MDLRKHHRKKIIVFFLMAVHVVLAACTYIFSKAAAVGFPDPGSLTLLRAMFAAVIYILLTGWIIPKPRFSLADWVKIYLLGILIVPFNQYLFLIGIQYTTPSHPALLYAMTPMVVMLVMVLVNRAYPSLLKTTGALIAFSGVILILRPWEQGDLISDLRSGDLIILLAVFSFSIYTVGVKGLYRKYDVMTVTAWTLITGATAIVPFTWQLLITMDFALIPAKAWFSFLWMVIMTSVVMMLLWNMLLKQLRPEQVAICTNAQPPVTAILSAIFVYTGFLDPNQDMGILFWVGMAIILSGIVMVQKIS